MAPLVATRESPVKIEAAPLSLPPIADRERRGAALLARLIEEEILPEGDRLRAAVDRIWDEELTAARRGDSSGAAGRAAEAREACESIGRKLIFLRKVAAEVGSPQTEVRLGAAHHDLINGCGVLLAYLEMVSDAAGKPDELKEVLGMASIERVQRRLGLDRSRLERLSPLALSAAPEDLSAILQSVVDEVRSALPAGSSIRVGLQFRGAPVIVSASAASMIGVAVEELVRNGIDALERGDGSVTVRFDRGREGFLISVSDTGCGMPPDRIAEFFKDGVSTKQKVNGGLGLGIVKRAVAAAGATLSLESKVGQGTTFHIHSG